LSDLLTLMPCPFCGSSDVALSMADGDVPRGWVTCGDCECDGPLTWDIQGKQYDHSITSAVEAWNKRVGKA
jgi:Lar family restriction alleviation protein